jgi:glycosyltransferase involved in cell wall biosynthesis
MFGKLNYFDKIFDSFVDAFIYISRAIAEDYTTQDISPTKGRVIHNAVEFSEFSQAYDPKSVRREFGWNDHNRIIGLVGRLDWWKGHDYFLEAMSDICHKVPDVRGLIVGEPQDTPRNQEYYQMLRSLTKSLDLEEKVIFTGFRSDVPRLMSAFDIVVLSSSRPEPFGRVVIEGMAAGKPVVATAAGGVLDIIEDGLNGLLVPCQDSKALARAIHWLLDNKSQAQQMGAAARKRVTQKFTLSKHVAAVQKLYAAITQQRTEIL